MKSVGVICGLALFAVVCLAQESSEAEKSDEHASADVYSSEEDMDKRADENYYKREDNFYKRTADLFYKRMENFYKRSDNFYKRSAEESSDGESSEESGDVDKRGDNFFKRSDNFYKRGEDNFYKRNFVNRSPQESKIRDAAIAEFVEHCITQGEKRHNVKSQSSEYNSEESDGEVTSAHLAKRGLYGLRVGKRGLEVGKRANFVGKRANFVGKRGKFVGKRGNLSTAEEIRKICEELGDLLGMSIERMTSPKEKKYGLRVLG